jgi:hypothetical protein
LIAQKKNFRQGGEFEGVRSDRRPVVCKAPSKQVILTVFLSSESGRTSVKKLLPPQAMRGI